MAVDPNDPTTQPDIPLPPIQNPVVQPIPVQPTMPLSAEGPSWKIRKRIVYLTLLFCALIITYVTYKGADTRLNETIIQFSYMLGASTIGSFIFGAVWHDSSVNRQQ